MSLESGQTLKALRLTASVAPTWGADWQSTVGDALLSDLIGERVAVSAGPDNGVAELTWHYGKLLRHEADVFEAVAPLEIADWFLKIEDDQGGLWFIGVVAAETRSFSGGDLYPPVMTGDQSFTCKWLTWLLARVRIGEAWVRNDATGNTATSREEKIGFCPPFNEKFERGVNEVGNRSSTTLQHQLPAAQPGGIGELVDTHVFSGDAAVWNHRQILEYLLAHYQPRGVRFVLTGQAEALEALTPARLSLQGQSVLEAVNHLVDRRRGLGWLMEFDGEANQVEIRIFTVYDQAISAGSFTVPANDVIVPAWDVSGIEYEEVTRSVDLSTRYGKIRVLGERVRSMFTLSVEDGTLDQAWNDTDEAAYKAGGGFAAGNVFEKEAERKREQYRHVFTTFAPPAGWDWTAIDGDGMEWPVMPLIDADGTIQGDQSGNLRDWASARVFLDRLPLQAPGIFGHVSIDYRRPLAFLHDAAIFSGRHMRVDQISAHHPGIPGGSVEMVDNLMVARIAFEPAYLLAKNHWSESNRNTRDGLVFDWVNLLATVAIETDQRLQYAVELGNGVEEELVIEVEDARLDWIVPGTAYDVQTDGTLLRYAPTEDLDREFPWGCVLRNDLARLQAVAAHAAGWYGHQRSALVVQIRGIDAGYVPSLGALVQKIRDNGAEIPVGTVVTELQYDFRQWGTRVATSYAELDFASAW